MGVIQGREPNLGLSMRLFSAILCAILLTGAQGALAAGNASDSKLWTFGRLDKVGGVAAHPEGAPQIIQTPAGPAVQFDGVKDALFVDEHPLAGAETWSVEAVFRPDGGAFEQRWMHLAEVDPKTGEDTGARFLFEMRVVGDRWYLDAFTHGEGYHLPMMATDKTYPLGRWYRVAMTYDGKIFRSYVDGALQMEMPLVFKPQGPGHSAFGTRINRVNYFHGAVFSARFTRHALTPEQLAPLPAGLDK